MMPFGELSVRYRLERAFHHSPAGMEHPHPKVNHPRNRADRNPSYKLRHSPLYLFKQPFHGALLDFEVLRLPHRMNGMADRGVYDPAVPVLMRPTGNRLGAV